MLKTSVPTVTPHRTFDLLRFNHAYILTCC